MCCRRRNRRPDRVGAIWLLNSEVDAMLAHVLIVEGRIAISEHNANEQAFIACPGDKTEFQTRQPRPMSRHPKIDDCNVERHTLES